jgi:hypothetical protein
MTAHSAKVDRCWHSGQPLWIWQPLDLDHVKARALGGQAGRWPGFMRR